MRGSFRFTLAGSLLTAFLIQSSVAYSQPINLVVKLKERVSMQTLAENAVQMGVIYTPDQIREFAAPSDQDYENLITQLKGRGFEIVGESKTRLFVTVRAEKSVIENAFQTKLEENLGTRRPLVPALVPADFDLVESVIGLSNERKLKPRFKVQAVQGEATGSDSPGGVLPADIKTAYGFDSIYQAGFTGKGQHIAIATYDGIHLQEVQDYYKKIGLTSAPSVDTVTFNGTPDYNMDSAMETELDAEFSGMIAPGASIHVFTSAENSDAGELAMFTAILDDNRAKVVNYSWGSCEPELAAAHKTAMDSIFARAVAQGVNITVASGDSGNMGCSDQPDTVAADYPASNPNVVAVGGTTLVNAGGSFETAWDGSGGGISTLYALPDYQSGFASPYTMRSIPDVAFNADPKSGEAAWEMVDSDGTASATTPSWIVLGGTSIAAPQWAGFLTLVGEARASKGLASLGFLNPILYGLNTDQKASAFNDVTQGSNGYPAGPGWDAVTGWGSMKASGLFADLTQ